MYLQGREPSVARRSGVDPRSVLRAPDQTVRRGEDRFRGEALVQLDRLA